MIAASNKIIAIPVVNQVVMGEITARRIGIYWFWPNWTPLSEMNLNSNLLSPEVSTSSGTST